MLQEPRRSRRADGRVTEELDAMDRRLLNLMQRGLPLTEDPYGQIALDLEIDPDEVLERLARLRTRGFIRRIGAVLNPSRLGYTSGLYALEVPEERYEATVRLINAYPGVTHNYRRNSRLNLWFTLSAPSGEEKARILDRILQVSQAGQVYDFPSEQVFKLNVYLDMEGGTAHGTRFPGSAKPDGFVRCSGPARPDPAPPGP